MRDYDPTTGRYVQADPLGLVDGASVYGYALGNPLYFFDFNGLNRNNKKPPKPVRPPNPNQKKGAETRQPGGNRERNIGHPDAEEHNRRPKGGFRPRLALNVNFPPKQNEKLKGIRVCRQANAKWVEEFVQRHDPNGRPYFWMTGNFVNFDKGQDNDEWAIANNYVSVVPCQFDLTAHAAIPVLNEEWDILSSGK
jgi:hypothetical protein